MIFLEKFFSVKEKGSDIKTEILAGITTYLTMAYIIILQPLILSGKMFGMETGMNFGGIMFATCVASAFATFIMGIYANYPVALAPGMGENLFFVLAVMPVVAKSGIENVWQTSLGIVFISGVLFLLLTVLKMRKVIVDAISPSMKSAIAVGIGLFIAFIGLKNAQIIVGDRGTFVSLTKSLYSFNVLLFITGLIVTSVLHTRKVKGSILIGILFSAFLCIAAGISGKYFDIKILKEVTRHFDFNFGNVFFKMPDNPFGVSFKLDVFSALNISFIHIIIILLFMDVFDTLGTFIGVAGQLDEIKDNKIPRIEKAMLADSVGTVAGALLGTSTVTSFIESSAGIEQGGRTGLTAVVAGVLLLLSLIFYPFVKFISGFPAITAPALVIVGSMMIKNVRKIDWDDYSEAIPSFLVILGIPLSFSISDGLSMGIIIYPIIKFLAGKSKDIGMIHWALSLIFVLRYILI